MKKLLASLALVLLALASLNVSTPVFANTAPLDTPAVTGSAIPATATTLTPVADAHVNAASPNTNYGRATQLRVGSSPTKNAYLRFNVQLNTGPITKATLRLFANNKLSGGLAVRAVANNSWSESTITYSKAPALGSVLAKFGAITAGTWISVDVTPYVTGNGTYTFGLISSNLTALSIASRESTNAPQLIIMTGTSTLP